jgi:exopolysaccharide biosynthesis polyprenyl glycosylphosphotransferase
VKDLLPQISYRVTDQVITLVSFLLGYFLAASLEGQFFVFWIWKFKIGVPHSLSEFVFILMVLPIIWWVVLGREPLYDPIVLRNPKALLWSLVKSNLTGGIALAGFFFLSKFYFPSRAQIIFFLIINTFALYGEKRLIVYWGSKHKKEKSLQRILMVGLDVEMVRMAEYIKKYPEMGYTLVGCLGDYTDLEKPPSSLKVLGSLPEFEKVVKENPVDEIILFSFRKIWANLTHILQVCQDMGIRVTMVPQWSNLQFSDISFRRLASVPLISFLGPPRKDISLFIKAISDFLIALAALILSAPLFLLITLLIKVDSKGPVFFRQQRCGLHGRVFPLIKFRSMVQDAETMQESLKAFNEMSGPVFKMKADPRVTRVGYWLRKTSLDELPQLINVLKGDLSLVGPRPPLPAEVAQYERWQRRRLSVKPGITCTWQISGRNDINFEEWIQLDLHYIDHWSLLLDFKILIRTIPAVLSGRGAR